MFVGEQIDWVPPTPNAARAGTDELGTTGLWFARLSETDRVLWKQVRNMNLRFSRLAFGMRSDGSVVVAGPMGHYQGCSGHNARGSSWMLSITPDGDVAFSKEYLELRLFGFFQPLMVAYCSLVRGPR